MCAWDGIIRNIIEEAPALLLLDDDEDEVDDEEEEEEEEEEKEDEEVAGGIASCIPCIPLPNTPNGVLPSLRQQEGHFM